MDYLHVDWMVPVPETEDIELMKTRAKALIPTEFYGLEDVTGGVRVTTDADYPDEDGEDFVDRRAIDLLREFTTRTMTIDEAGDWYRKVKALLALHLHDLAEKSYGEDA